MNNHKLKTDEAFDKAINESKKYLGSMSALDFMEKAGEFHKQLMILVNSLHLPASLVIGILMSEVHRVCNEAGELRYLSAFELFKQYVDENFMKKE